VSRSEQADLSEIPVGEGQTLRPAEESDAEAIAAVANAMSDRLYGEAAVSPDEIRRWFAYTELEARVVEMNGHVVGYMDVERRAGGRIQNGRVRSPRRLGVSHSQHPDRRRGGVGAGGHPGRGLHAGLCLRAGGLSPAGTRGSRLRLHPPSPVHADRAVSEPPDPGWPEGILVRPFRPGDERAVYEADMECLVYAGAGADAAWDRHSCAPPSPSSAGAERHASGSPSTPKT
jgi:hypothetical protein